MHKNPVIVSCCRTAIGRSHPQRGYYRNVRGDELSHAVIAAVVTKSGIDPAHIEDVVLGTTQQQGELGGNVARVSALCAGLPLSVAGTTVNRLCGSSLQALSQACHSIAAGAEDVQIVAGVEHMHHLPMETDIDLHPRLFERTSRAAISMGMTAEYLAASLGISREEQESYAFQSHHKACQAVDSGAFEDEIIPHRAHDESGMPILVVRDQSVRADASLLAMSQLDPAFLPRLGTVTAATSAPLSDGAAAMMVMSTETAEKYSLQPLVRVLATAVVGVPPALMGTGPVAAVQKLLFRAGVSLDRIDLIEINEAFAAQSIACIRQLQVDPSRVNVHGGSLAIGHPLGASGARICTTLVHAMHARKAKLGVATMCIGLGQGIAVLLERIEL